MRASGFISAFVVSMFLAVAAPAAARAASADLEWARENFVTGRYADASTCLDKVLAGNDEGEKAAARLLVARIRMITGKYDDVAKVFEGVKDAPVDAQMLMADALMVRGKYKEAGELYQKALDSSDGKSAIARLGLISVYETTGQDPKAEELRDWFFKTYQKSGQIRYTREGKDVTDATELLAIGMAMAKRDPQGAINALTCAEQAEKRGVDAYLASYNLFAERFAWAQADQELAKALAINKRSPDVQLALAGQSWARKEDAKAAEKAIDEALATNPNLLGAHVLRAMLSLYDDEHEKAKKSIDAALAVNPNSTEALSTLAAWHYDQAQEAEFETACKKVLEINPGCAELYTMLAGCCERKRQFPAAERFNRRAMELDPKNWQGYYGAGMSLVRRGQDAEGKKLLEKAFELNKHNMFCRNMLVVLDKLVPPEGGAPKFETVKTAHFVITAPVDDAPFTLPYYSRWLEESYARLHERYKFTPEGPIVVEIFNSHGDFSARTAGVPGIGADGACFGKFMTLNDAKVWQAKSVPLFNWAIVAEHELMHVFSLQATGYRIPRWLTEGMSVYEESAPRIELDRMFVSAAQGNGLVKVANMNREMSRPTVPTNAILSYYQASRIVDYIYTTGGADGMQKLLGELRAGRKPEEALKTALGMTMDQFEAAVLEHQKKFAAANIRLTPQYDQATLTKLLVEVKASPDDAEKLATLAAAYASPELKRYDAAKKNALEVLKKTTEGPAAARANAVLGILAFEKDKKYSEAKEHFTKALAADQESFSAHLFLGRIAIKEGDWKGALEHLEKSRKIYPRFAGQGESSPLELLYKTYDGMGEKDKALDSLRELVAMDKLNIEPAVRLARLAVGHGKTDLAQWSCYQAIKIDSFAFEPHLLWGQAAAKAGDNATAEREFSLAAKANATSSEAKEGLARALWANGKKNEARQAAAEAAALAPESSDLKKLTAEYGPPEAKPEPKPEEKPVPKTEPTTDPERGDVPKLEKLKG